MQLLSPNSTNANNVFNANSGIVTNFGASGQDGSVLPALYLKSNITLTGSGTNDENIYRIS